ncbi:BatD family protein [Sulfurimonas sp. SAG-AH-194-L11]|nr:hypothetical protein [Sulfurimonas sp. SAG-AH-194-L11]MDF1876442.1 BatD family protein [Sulfurimonas sp. SAG-AH-194-L11]
MKKSLTSIVVLLVVLVFDLSASTYKWSAKANKKTAYVNEAILLTYVCEFSDASELYTIDFKPVQDNEHFSIQLLKESQGLNNSKRVNTYKYIAYVKKEGPISFDFDVVMKKTTQESIDSTTNGHYDDSKVEAFISTPMKQLPLSLIIKETPAQLVGEFTLRVKQDIAKHKAYEPYNLEIQIEGVGNFSSLAAIDFSIDGVKTFTQNAVVKSDLTQDGEKGVWSQKFAFVSDKNFTIPSFKLEYFDLKVKKIVTLDFHRVNAVLSSPDFVKEKLLDSQEDYIVDIHYIYYILVFIVGFILAKIEFPRLKHRVAQEDLFCKRIHKINSLEKLSFILVAKDIQKYKEIIYKIEIKELTSLKEVKKLICNLAKIR